MTAPTSPTGTRPNGIVERLAADRHSLPLSLALHLVPGALIVGAYFLVGEPIATAIGFPPFLGWTIALCLALAPVQLGLLLWLGYRRNGRLSVRGVVRYLDTPLRRGPLGALVAVLVGYFLVVAFALTPMDTVVYETFFRWLPFEGAGTSTTGYLDGYPRGVVIAALAVGIPFTGLSLPIIEELYFRGFLLPRLPVSARWAPLVSSALFSVYHFWSPWAVLSRVLYLLPGIWLVQRHRDLRISIGMHAGTTLVLQTLGMLAFALNLVP